MERLFGVRHDQTLAARIATCRGIARTWTQRVLDLAKLVYNEYRPRQALGGLTPMQAWHGMNWIDVGGRRERAGHEVDERLRC